MFGDWAHKQSTHVLACKTGQAEKGSAKLCNRQPGGKPDVCSHCHKTLPFGCQSYVQSFMDLLDQSGQRDCVDQHMELLRVAQKTTTGWDNPPGWSPSFPSYQTCKRAIDLKIYDCNSTVKGSYTLKDYCPVTCNNCGKREVVNQNGAYEYKYGYGYVIPDGFDPTKNTMADVCPVTCNQCELA